MARLVTSGFEFQALHPTAVGAAEGDGFRVTAGSPTVETTVVRSGAAALKVAAASNTVIWGPTTVLDRTYFHRFYFRYSGTLTGTPLIWDAGSTRPARILLNTDGTLQLRDIANANVGSASAAMAADTWYRIEVAIMVPTSGNGTLELRLNGATVASSGSVSVGNTAVAQFRIGATSATAPGANLYFDDVAINDSTGSAQSNWPSEGRIALLKPVSIAATGGNWIGGGGGAAAVGAVDNTPPVGVAVGSATDSSQLKNIVDESGTADDQMVFNTAAYTASVASGGGGLTASDHVMVVQAVVTHASGTTASLSTLVNTSANPVGADAAFATGAIAGATFPTGWTSLRNVPSYEPSVTLGTGVEAWLRKESANGTDALMVAFAGVYVEYRTPQVVSVGQASETDTAQALDVDKHVTLAPADETDTAQLLDAEKRVTLVPVAEADTAQALSYGRAFSITPATTTEVAQPLSYYKRVTLGVATEVDEALAIGPSPEVPVSPGGAVPVRVRRPIREPRPHVLSLVAATETDTALPLSYEKRYTAEEDLLMLLASVA